MPVTLWTKAGALVSNTGGTALIECDECPCCADCCSGTFPGIMGVTWSGVANRDPCSGCADYFHSQEFPLVIGGVDQCNWTYRDYSAGPSLDCDEINSYWPTQRLTLTNLGSQIQADLTVWLAAYGVSLLAHFRLMLDCPFDCCLWPITQAWQWVDGDATVCDWTTATPFVRPLNLAQCDAFQRDFVQ